MEENILTMPRCKFCGKTMIAERKLLTESEAEEYAVMHCNCKMAEDYRLKVKKEEEKEKDKEKIRDAVAGIAEYCKKKMYVFEAEELLVSAGEAVLNGIVENISVNVFNVKVTISMSAKGVLKIKRSYKESAVMEVL